MCSTSIQQIHADYIQKVSTKVTSGYFLKEPKDFFHNVASMCPAGTLWKNSGVSFIMWLTMCPACNLSHSLRILSQCAHHFDLNVIAGHIEKAISMCPARWPLGTLWMDPLISLTILSPMCPVCTWATHWGFFHNIFLNVATMCPLGSFQCNLNVLSI